MDVIADFEAVIRDIRDARPVPFSASAIVDRKELLERLESLVEAIPGELKKARWVIEDRDEVLARIQREAQETLELARRERDRMLSRPEIDRAASIEAERVIEGAKAQAREIRLEAEHFVDGKLASLEVGLQKMLALVQSAAGAFPDRSAPVRPSPTPKRTPAPRQSPPEGERMRPADPLDMPHATQRRPASRSQPAPGDELPRTQRSPRPRRPAQNAPSRPEEAAAPPPTTTEEPPPGTVRSLGLGSPLRVKPGGSAGRVQGAPASGRGEASPPSIPPPTRVIRLDEKPGAPGSSDPPGQQAGEGTGEGSGTGPPAPLF